MFNDDDEQGASFSRAFDCKHQEQYDHVHHHYVEDRSEISTPCPKKEKVHPLKKLRDRSINYLQELPVLGFNSGKYDLNAFKVFCFLPWSNVRSIYHQVQP